MLEHLPTSFRELLGGPLFVWLSNKMAELLAQLAAKHRDEIA
jgi:hypothetical protein